MSRTRRCSMRRCEGPKARRPLTQPNSLTSLKAAYLGSCRPPGPSPENASSTAHGSSLAGTRASLELPLLECRHVQGREFEPFSIHSTIPKALVPVRFNSRRIIGSYRMDQIGLIGQRDADFPNSPFYVIASADFVEISRLDQIDKTIRCTSRGGYGRRGKRRADARQKRCDVIVPGVFAYVVYQSTDEAGLAAEAPSNCLWAWTKKVIRPINIKFGIGRKFPIMAAGLDYA